MTDLIQWPARGGTRGIRLGFSVKDKDGKRKSFTYEAGQEEVPARVGGQENVSKIKYAYKAKSAKIREAKSSAAVSELCARLSAEIKDLIEKLKSGEYDQTEILRALMHAERLEAAALKKLQDLRTEEAAERAMKSKKGQQQEGEGGTEEGQSAVEKSAVEKSAGEKSGEGELLTKLLPKDTDRLLGEVGKPVFERELTLTSFLKAGGAKSLDASLQKALEGIQKETEEMMREMGGGVSLSQDDRDLMRALSGEMTPEDLKEMKARHRCAEEKILAYADAEYLKALFSELEQQKNETGASFADFVSAPSDPVYPSASGGLVDLQL